MSNIVLTSNYLYIHAIHGCNSIAHTHRRGTGHVDVADAVRSTHSTLHREDPVGRG